MKFWTKDETIQWLRSVNIPTDGNRHVIIGEEWTAKSLTLPKEAYAQAELSLSIIEKIKPFKGCIFWITEWGVFPTQGNPILIERIRLSYGETRPLSEAPSFNLEATEKDEAIALLRLFVMFGWDGYLINPEGNFVLILTGHEAFAEICSKQ